MTSLEAAYFIARLSNPKYACGPLGEALAYHLLSDRGYNVTPTKKGCKAGDLKVIAPTGEVLRVEVKTSRQCVDNVWRFTLEKDGHTSIANTDIVLLLAVHKTGNTTPFVIPTYEILGKRQIAIRNPHKYKGRYAAFRQNQRFIKLEVQP